MNKCKRILAFGLLVLMLVGLLPVTTLAADAATTEGRPNLVGNGGFDTNDWKVTVGNQDLEWSNINKVAVATLEPDVTNGTNYRAKVGLAGTTSKAQCRITLAIPDAVFTKGHTYRFVVSVEIENGGIPYFDLRSDSASIKYVNKVENGKLTLDYEYTGEESGNAINIYLRNQKVNGSEESSYCYYDDFAIYDMTATYATYTWKNYDGTVLDTKAVDTSAGEPTYTGATPTWGSSDIYDYTFANSWYEADDGNGNKTFTAQYTRAKKLLSGGDFEAEYTAGEEQVITQLTFNGKSYNLTSSANASSSALSSEEGTYRSGKQSVKLQSGDGTGAVNAILTLLPEDLEQGHTYKVSVYSKKDTDVGRALIARVYKDNSNHNGDITATTTEVDGWILHELNFTYSSTDAGKVYIYFRNTTKNSTACYFDDFAIYDVTEAETVYTAPALTNYTMSLKGILDANFYVDWKDNNAQDYTVDIQVDGEARECTPNEDNTRYSAPVYYYEDGAEITATLKEVATGEVIVTKSRTVAEYAANLRAADPENIELDALLDALEDYMKYGAYYAKGEAASEGLTLNTTVFDGKYPATNSHTGTGIGAAPYLDEAFDLRLKFPKDKYESYTVTVTGDAYADDRDFHTNQAISGLRVDGDFYVLDMEQILLQDWDTTLTFTVTGVGEGDIVVTYSPMAYIRRLLTDDADETREGLDNLLRAMYYYQIAGEAYFAQ